MDRVRKLVKVIEEDEVINDNFSKECLCGANSALQGQEKALKEDKGITL